MRWKSTRNAMEKHNVYANMRQKSTGFSLHAKNAMEELREFLVLDPVLESSVCHSGSCF
jgi:hypothetical protein